MKKKIIYTILILFFSVELILRIINPLYIQYGSFPSHIYKYDSFVYYKYRPNTSFKVGNNIIPINRQGYIGEDFKTNDSTVYKIAVVGGSGVSGPNHILEYANYTFPLEEKLKNENYSVQVQNCGIDGANRSYLLLHSIYHYVMSFNPDIVLLECDLPLKSSNQVRAPYRNHLLFYPCGDNIRLQEVKAKVDKLIQYEWFFNILHQSYIFRALVKYKMNNWGYTNEFDYYLSAYRTKGWGTAGVIEEELSIEQSIFLIKELQMKLAEKNIKFFLLNTYGKTNMQIIKDGKLPCISTRLDFIEPDDFMYKDGHLNKQGCEKIADKLCDLFIKYELIPKKYLLKKSADNSE